MLPRAVCECPYLQPAHIRLDRGAGRRLGLLDSPHPWIPPILAGLSAFWYIYELSV